MTQTAATEAIALLIDLAQRGEINPWDVQVIEVIDRYLSELSLENEAQPGQRDADLSQSGQAFLWASMLVLLKADTLARLGEPEPLEIIDEEEENDTGGTGRLPLHLERHLRRRAAAPPPKKRPVTLSELIEQLQQMAAQLGEARPSTRTKASRSMSRTQAASTIAHLAHDENLTEIATRLEVFLSRHWQKLSAGKDWLNLDQLLEWWTLPSVVLDEVQAHSLGSTGEWDLNQADALREINTSPHTVEATAQRTDDRVGVFWALLLLSAQSKVELSQEEFYQDLKIRTLP